MIPLTITFSDDAYETFVEALRWPVEKEYNVKLILTDDSEFDVRLLGYATADEAQRDGAEGQQGIRFKRRMDFEGDTYEREYAEVVFTWHDKKPYLRAVHVY